MFHGGGQIFHGGVKHSTQRLKHSRGLNVPRRCERFHGRGKNSTEVVKYYTEVSNIPRGRLKIPRRCQIFYGGG